MFSFEQLIVYQRAVEFLALAVRITSELPRGTGYLADQLRRAALSIPANIAEGTGRPTDADQRRHYGIARGSAMESVVILDACKLCGGLGEADLVRGRGLLREIVSMLSRMCLPPQTKSKSKPLPPR